MEQVYLKPRKQYSGHRPISSNVIWVLACGALAVTGYFYGLHNGSTGAVIPSNLSSGSRAPAQANDTLPLGPGVGENTAPGDLLARARLENELLYTDLQSFVCSEHMDRYQSHLNGEKSRQIDTVNAQVSFENGVENYSDVRQNNRPRPALSSIPGAWSEGEFGTLLRQTRALLSSQPISVQASTDLDGSPAAMYSFDVAGQESPWELAIASKGYRVPFRTNVWVAKTSGQIMKIARVSTAIPPDSGISEIQWSVMLKPVDLDGNKWLLPSSGEYSVLYENTKHREWNTISFSDYRRYASHSVIHF
jgi:hypothetical protein